MSKPQGYGTGPREIEEGLVSVLDSIVRFLLWAGLLATVVAGGFLVYTFIAFAQGTPASAAQATSNIEVFQKVLLAGVAALGVGSAFVFWGEETLGVIQIGIAALLYFAPLLLPTIASGGQVSPVGSRALGALQSGGMIFGVIAVLVLVLDLGVRARDRAAQGSRADQLKYGKGIKEEKDIQNVFLGKCWQLPFCRKFVRERCPIYHSKRTCWKERVGCMCEEEVIRSAMENKPIPRDMVAATRYIPYNNRITMEAKKERCRQCVIYNEHQKHKYKAAMPIVLLVFVAAYAVFRAPLLVVTAGIVEQIDKVISVATFQSSKTAERANITSAMFQEALLICVLVIGLAYMMKLLEFLIFKLKV